MVEGLGRRFPSGDLSNQDFVSPEQSSLWIWDLPMGPEANGRGEIRMYGGPSQGLYNWTDLSSNLISTTFLTARLRSSCSAPWSLFCKAWCRLPAGHLQKLMKESLSSAQHSACQPSSTCRRHLSSSLPLVTHLFLSANIFNKTRLESISHKPGRRNWG